MVISSAVFITLCSPFVILISITQAQSHHCANDAFINYQNHGKPRTLKSELSTISSESLETVVSSLKNSMHQKSRLFEELENEGTTCYRIFHGATEGVPGLTVDKYGSQLLLQTFREKPLDQHIKKIADVTQENVGKLNSVIWRHRDRNTKVETHLLGNTGKIGDNEEGLECGLVFDVTFLMNRRDPLLYLDFRVVRRWLKANSMGKTVLNLFSYTCGASIAAAAGGAHHVTSVDFSVTALEVGQKNMLLNHFEKQKFDFICADVLPTIRQYASLPVGGRFQNGRKQSFVRVPKGKQFDISILDPPTWAKSSFGAVDIKRDYQSLFKPAVLATKVGGMVIATNHLSTVDKDEWLNILQKCAIKAGRSIRSLEVLSPEKDFPSPDGCHPLKIAIAHV